MLLSEASYSCYSKTPAPPTLHSCLLLIVRAHEKSVSIGQELAARMRLSWVDVCRWEQMLEKPGLSPQVVSTENSGCPST